MEVLLDTEGNQLESSLIRVDSKSNKNIIYKIKAVNDENRYKLVYEYGRVGNKLRTKTVEYNSYDALLSAFKSRYERKTDNLWGIKFVFRNRYKPVNKAQVNRNKLVNDNVVKLIKLITEEDIPNNNIKLALEITEKDIDRAKTILTEIRGSNEIDRLELSNRYYEIITLKWKLKPIQDEDLPDHFIMLNELQNTINIKEDPCEKIYKDINKVITKVEKSSETFKTLLKCINSCKGPTHRFKLKLKDVYRIGESNKKSGRFLFHGSSTKNWHSILKKGLLIDPEKESIKITGKMFGHGIYFTDCITKSAHYCEESGLICILLAKIDTGREFKAIRADPLINKTHLNRLGYDTTKGIGRFTPSRYLYFEGGVLPIDKMKQSGTNSSLIYNETVVYEPERIDYKFLLILEKKV